MSENRERFQAPDTSHYDDCRGLMQSIRTHRTVRFFITIFFCVLSIVLHTMPLAAASDTISMARAFLSLPFSAFVIWQAALARSEQMKPLIKLMVVLGIGAVTQWMNAGAAIALMIVYATQIPETRKLEWLKTQEGYPHFEHYITIQEYGLEEYHPPHDTSEQKYNGEMPELSDKERDNFSTSRQPVMPSAEGMAALKAPVKPEMPARPEIAVPAAFAGISPMDTEKPAADTELSTAKVLANLPEPEKPAVKKKKSRSSPWLHTESPKRRTMEPEVPAADFDIPTDIPDPVWNVPDPVLDTSAVVSNFPEIAGDIADLPDIPDIPQI